MVKKNKKTSERTESLMRIVVGIVSGIILGVWRYLIYAFSIINFFVALFSNKRIKEVASLSEVWNTQTYTFLKYMTFVTNERPFPFSSLKKNLSKFN
ncbi:DUF4389 domain-containing protein [archaeon]|nr:DUF4389 domain-containing protein [archaeon]